VGATRLAHEIPSNDGMGWRPAGSRLCRHGSWFQEERFNVVFCIFLLSLPPHQPHPEYTPTAECLAAGLLSPQQFLQRLSAYVDQYQKLAHTDGPRAIEKARRCTAPEPWSPSPGTCQIRAATHNTGSLNDVCHRLAIYPIVADVPILGDDIKKVAQIPPTPADWQTFYTRYIDGDERLR